MMPTPDAIAGWLIAVSWQLLPLTVVIIILDLALRRAGPVVRSALWWMVLAKLIVPPGIASPLSIAQLWPVEGVTAIVAATAFAPVATTDGSLSSPLAMIDAAAPEARAEGTDASASRSGSKDLGVAREQQHDGRHQGDIDSGLPGKSNRASGAAALMAIWAAGAFAAAVLAYSRYRRLRAACLDGAELLTDAAPEARQGGTDGSRDRSGGKDLRLPEKSNRASGAAADLRGSGAAPAAARRLGLSTLPPIFVAAHGARAAGLPAVIGFFRPCIVLPRPLLERSRGEIEHVLLHELAHVRRGDPLASLVCLVAQIVFWFHPAVWCACRRLTTLREMACDRTVARLLGDATPAYRRTLILLARSAALATAASGTAAASTASANRFAGGPGALGLFQRQSQLVTRLDALARPVSMRRATECAASAAIAAAILVSCVPLARVPAAPTVSIDVPPLDQLPGSLQKRYAVMRAMALAEQAQSPQPPR